MAILGVNGSSNGLWLAVVSDNGDIVDAPVSLAPSADTPLEVQIANTVEAASRLFTSYGITRVVLLDAEPAAQTSYGKQIVRISLEAAVMLAAWKQKVPVARRSRASVRSAFKLPRTGSLASHVASVVEPHSPHWANKRDLAALVALAARASEA
jgi:hypothetical protein